MQTTIDIDEALLAAAQATQGFPSREAAIEAGLRLLIRRKEQQEILGLAGTVEWVGNLDESREGRFPP